MKEHDIVITKITVDKIPQGSKGAIVFEHCELGEMMYEVEFIDLKIIETFLESELELI